MATTLEELEKRLAQVERDVTRLRQLVEPTASQERPTERGARLLKEARSSQPAISKAAQQAFDEMGITGEPVGLENLREMMAAGGVKAEENAFSREIIAMREE